MSNGIGHVWAVNAEGGDEGRPNGVGPVWIENADQLGSKLPEPEAGDTGKVLGVLNAEGDIGWVPDQEGMAQVQSDWAQTDSSQVSYIANKPSLATVATTGAYTDLSNKPTIPSGAQLVPAATSADADKVLTVDSLGVPGWAVIPAQPTGLFEAVYGTTTFADITQAITDKRIVYCKVDQGNGQARMAFLAYVSNIAAEFQYYRSISSHSASTQTDEVYIYKVNADGWTTTTRKAGVNVAAGTHMSQSYSNDTLTLNCTWPTVDQTYDASSVNAQSGVAVASALSSKQDTISDLSTIRSGASAGATAVQPGDLATVATTGSYDDLSDKPTIPSTKPLVAGTNITITENTNDVTISASGSTVTVDQTYNAASANAQSGVAVAQAIAAIPSASYTAGDGISIDENDEISAKLGDGLEIGTSLSPVTVTARGIGYNDEDHESSGVSVMQQLYPELVAAIETTGLTYTVQNLTDNNNVSQPWGYGGVTSLKLYPAICGTVPDSCGTTPNTGMRLVLSTTGIDVASSSGSITAGTQFAYNLDDVNTSQSNITWERISNQPENYTLCVIFKASWGGWSCLIADGSYTENAMYETGTLSYQTATLGAIAVSNPLPAVTSTDDGKVLKATYSGGAGSYTWESEPTMVGIVAGSNVTVTEGASDITIAATDTTYTAGNMIAIDANSNNAIGVSTTAGITDIQQVAALPANPVATVLYLIPET